MSVPAVSSVLVNVLSYIQYASSVSVSILAHIGFTTTLLESVATSIGAGMLMGGFVVGAAGLLLGWPRKSLEGRSLSDGYVGGLVAAVLLIFDFLMRYIV
jgi:hypothetical protein